MFVAVVASVVAVVALVGDVLVGSSHAIWPLQRGLDRGLDVGEAFFFHARLFHVVKACVGSNPVAYPVSEIDRRALESIGHSGGGGSLKCPF